jgi:hypothetical protein
MRCNAGGVLGWRLSVKLDKTPCRRKDKIERKTRKKIKEGTGLP